MFEAVELGQKLSKEDYKASVPELREDLLDLQRWVRDQKVPVIVTFAGVDGAGKSEIVNLLNSWMDPRWIMTRAFMEPSDEETERPPYWRYWLSLPPKGLIGLYLSTWYSQPTLDFVYGKRTAAEFDDELDRIRRYERMLAADGALILKFWMHLGKEDQKQRFRALEKDPLQSWRVTETDWRHWRMYDKFQAAAERLIQHTSTGEAPWKIVEGLDLRYSSVTVATLIRDALRSRRAAMPAVAASAPKPAAKAAAKAADKNAPKWRPEVQGPGIVTVLSRLDHAKALKPKAYDKQLARWQAELAQLGRKARAKKTSSILVFEGSDAAGKGGAIRRITGALDARLCQTIPIAAPTDEERAHHYLWRFWRHLPRAGRVTIFDRSWYGRVLVERVEGFAREDEWRRAYEEINDFEEQLVEHGIVICKFWLHITPDEQLRRFKEREETRHKQWKLTEEDWRNREKWGAYELAVNDMVERTSTRVAPWTLVEANDKRFARVKILKTFCERLQKVL